MNHVYKVSTCVGDLIMFVEIALPDGCTDPTHIDACIAAVEAADCNPWAVCDGCYDRRFHADWVGPAEEFFGIKVPGSND